MPNMSQGDLIEWVIVGSLYGQTTMNVFHYVCDAAPTDPTDMFYELDVFMQSVDQGVGTVGGNLRACVTTDWLWTRQWAQVIYPNRWMRMFRIPPGDGLVDPPSLPSHVTWDISLRDGQAQARKNPTGIGHIGRKAISGTPQTAVVGDTLETTFFSDSATPLATAMNQNRVGSPGSLYVPVIYNRSLEAEPYSRIIAADAMPIVRSDKRRQLRPII